MVLAGLTAMAIATGPALLQSLRPGGPKNDFRSFYLGGRLAGSQHLYAEANRAAQLEADASGQNPLPFIRPPFYAALLAPLARLPYVPAYIVWQVCSFLVLFATALAWRQEGAALWSMACAWSVPAAYNLIRGQDAFFLLAILSASVLLLRTGRDVLAGLIFALCGIKWHLFLLLPVFIAASRRWRFGAGAVAGCAALAGFSFAAAGWNWPLEYRDVVAYASVTPHWSDMPNLRGLLFNAHLPRVFELLMSGAGICLIGFRLRRMPCDQALLVAVAGGVLVSPHAYLYDCVLFIPLLVTGLRFGAREATRVVSLLLLTPFFYLPFFRPGYEIAGQICLLAGFAVLAADTFQPGRSLRTTDGRRRNSPAFRTRQVAG